MNSILEAKNKPIKKSLFKSMIISTPMDIFHLLNMIALHDGRAFIVGGAIRDAFLGKPINDYDIEVFGIKSISKLKSILLKKYEVNEVGKSYSILKVRLSKDIVIDISLPRRDEKTGIGHKGFSVTSDSNMTIEEAASRRDFTINSMAYDILSGELLDPFNGEYDLKNKILRHVGPRFGDDPLRVFRACQFTARFNLKVTKELIYLMRTMPINELPKDRIWEEIKKILLLSEKPSIGFELMREIGVISIFPELNNLIGLNQDSEWHPEGDVWVHTMMVIDEMAKLRTNDTNKDLILMLGALCHDFGKVTTTEFIDGRIRSRGHEEQGGPLAEKFIHRLTDDKKIIEGVIPLVVNHLKPSTLYASSKKDNVTISAIRRLSLKVNLKNLLLISKADNLGRKTNDAKKKECPACDWFSDIIDELDMEDSGPTPFISGRHLLDIGMLPGPNMGKIIRLVFEDQLDGKVKTLDEAVDLAEKISKSFS